VGLFTQLADRDVAELADVFELGMVLDFEPIAAGTINSNFRVKTGQGADRRLTFLRINEGKSEEDVAYEARLVEAFAAGGVPTPAPLVARDGRRYAPFRGKFVSAFPWRPGVHLAPLDVTADTARALGAALAQLHETGLHLPADWRRASIYDFDHLRVRFAAFRDSPDPELAKAISILREELAYLEAQADVRAAATQGIIHGDLFRDNVLWDGGQIVAILDFEQASGGSLAYDLAVCINDWCWTEMPRLDLAAALLAGYRTRRAIDREALVIEVRAAAARFTITRITDVYLAKVPNPEKDFRAFLARVEAWRGPALHQLSALL
jgi:homoserine kinase type II